MEGSSQTSSRQSNPLVTKVKALLMRAWRERWNEVQWGIQLKRVMSTTPGDNKDLAGNTQCCGNTMPDLSDWYDLFRPS